MNPKAHFKKITRRFGVLRYSAVELLITLVLLFAVMPYVDTLRQGVLIETVLMTLVMVSAVLAVGGQRRLLGIAVLLVLPAILSKWAHQFYPTLLPTPVHLVLNMVFIAFIVANMLRFIMKAPRVNAEVLSAGIVVYLMIGLLWVFAYLLVCDLSPDAFTFNTDPNDPRTMTRFNAFYYSFSTLCSNGFGDITPVSKEARTLSIMESMTGLFYVAILISRLVSMYAPMAADAAAENGSKP